MPVAREQPVTNPASQGERVAPANRDDRLRALFSRFSLVLGVVLLIATFFLLSPPRGETYPGARPWSELSILRPLTELMSLNGLAATARGTEIKDFALHLAAVFGLLVLAGRLWFRRGGSRRGLRLTEPWFSAQLLLGGWVLLSALSVLWSGDPALACGQATLYALAVAWALSLAWTLERRDVPRLLAGLVAVSALAAGLCIWYYFERNPHHRPGFPLGNPGTLAAALLPAILIAIGVVVGALQQWRRTRRPPEWLPTIGAAAALLPLLGCFVLLYSRAAILGLAVGLAALVALQSGRRLRWLLASVMLTGLATVGVWTMSYSHLDAAMARSATIRFRVYAWRYAAELWNQSWLTAIAGHGAGAYPRLAGQFSIHDRMLDPAAFMSDELVEHAHNELFEVLTEIGLVGGVTFVGGLLATLLAGRALLHRRLRDRRRWLYAALVAALAALMTDALFAPGLRLAGVPAVFYTLVGTLWATCRLASQPRPADALADLIKTSAHPTDGRALRPIVAGAVAVALAVGGGWLTVRNWAGVLREEAASVAFARGDFAQAAEGYDFAESRLLDPVRQLVNRGYAMHARLGAAREAYEAFYAEQTSAASAPGSQPTTTAASDHAAELRHAAIERCEQTYTAAGRLSQQAPTLMHTAAVAARAAELLGDLYDTAGEVRARDWWRRAGGAWREQRKWRRYDFETLLALTQYPAPPNYHAGLLRDALRCTTARRRWGPPLTFDGLRWEWQQALRRLAARKGFADTVREFLAVIGPVAPETDLDTLVASRAPEVYRLAAHAAALRGDFSSARLYAARAALLYEPMRPRFPMLGSIALLEQAEFVLRGSPEQAQLAVDLLREAIEQLPQIQQQKYDAMARPFREWLAIALLAAGAEDRAGTVLGTMLGDDGPVSAALAETYVRLVVLYIRRPPEQRPDLEQWLAAALRYKPDYVFAWSWVAWLAAERGDVDAVHAALADAARSGVGSEDVHRIRRSLCQEFPELSEQIGGGE